MTGVEGGPLSGDEPIVAEIIGFQGFDDGDNGLLKIANMDGMPALPIAGERPEIGEEVTAIGFPGEVSAVTDVKRQSSSYKGGEVSSHGVSLNGAPITEIDASVSGGMSGGPTLNEAGEVIGLYYGNYTGATSVLKGLVFGRIAGADAASHRQGETA